MDYSNSQVNHQESSRVGSLARYYRHQRRFRGRNKSNWNGVWRDIRLETYSRSSDVPSHKSRPVISASSSSSRRSSCLSRGRHARTHFLYRVLYFFFLTFTVGNTRSGRGALFGNNFEMTLTFSRRYLNYFALQRILDRFLFYFSLFLY